METCARTNLTEMAMLDARVPDNPWFLLKMVRTTGER